MSFSNDYRRVLREDNPLARRVGAFKWCIESYCWLTGEHFEATYARLGSACGFTRRGPLTPEQLRMAAVLLRAERERYLQALRAFAATRREDKAQGRRRPSKAQLATLRSQDWFLTRGDHP